MSTGLGSRRWLGVTLLIALFSLFTFADLQARDARPEDPVPSGICDFGEPDSDPWMVGAEPVDPCAGLEGSEVQSVDFVGDFGLMRVFVGDEVESRVYQRTDAGWELIHVMSTGDGEVEYLFELESTYDEQVQDAGFSPELAIQSSDSIWAVQGEAYGDYLLELENASAEGTQDVGFVPQPAIGFASPSANLSVRSDYRFEGFIDYHNPTLP